MPVARTILLPATLAAALLALSAGAASAAVDPTITRVAGTGQGGFAGDGGPAPAALMRAPRDVERTADGGFLIADRQNNRVRRVAPNGAITTIAGDGAVGSIVDQFGDGEPATSAQLDTPTGVAVLPGRGVLIADALHHRVRLVRSFDNRIETFAGTTQGFAGDGGPASGAQLDTPREVAAMPDGAVLIVDSANDRIRRVAPNGTITTVAGTGAAGFSGDNGPAGIAQLTTPFDVSPTPDGGYLIADTGNNRIRRVAPNGTITTVAGTGAATLSGDGRPALRATLNAPAGVEAIEGGGFLIADSTNDRVRRVSPGGTMTTVAGTTPGAGGDGGPGSRAQLDGPSAVALRADGTVLVADTENHEVRGLSATGAPPPPATLRSVVLDPVAGTVRYRQPGKTAFTTLKADDSIPDGSYVDAAVGTVKVSASAAPAIGQRGSIERMDIDFGPFVIDQQAGGARPITELRLRQPPPRCPARGAAVAAARGPLATAARKRRRLFARGKGRFRTRGRYGSATVRGTSWLTEDRCDGTLFKVREGRVAVRDFVRGKTVFVSAGERYFARARR